MVSRDRALSSYERTVARFRRQVLARDDATRRTLAIAYREAQRELRRRIEVLETQDPLSLRVLRLRELERQVEQEIQRLIEVSARETTAGQRDMIALASDQAPGIVAAQAPGIEVAWTRLPTTAFEGMVGSLGNGTPLSGVLARYGAVAAGNASRILRDAVVIGTGPRSTARQLRDTLGILQWEAERIARTEQLRVFREASRLVYQANRDIVRGYRRVATKDARTCPVCLALDGKLYALDRMMESHPNCRCTLVPELHEAFGDMPAMETGPEWFDRQPAAIQRQVLGPGKFELFAAGEIRLSDLPDLYDDPEWGPQVREVPLRELERRIGRAA